MYVPDGRWPGRNVGIILYIIEYQLIVFLFVAGVVRLLRGWKAIFLPRLETFSHGWKSGSPGVASRSFWCGQEWELWNLIPAVLLQVCVGVDIGLGDGHNEFIIVEA